MTGDTPSRAGAAEPQGPRQCETWVGGIRCVLEAGHVSHWAPAAGASREERAAEPVFQCSFCQRGDYCPTAPHAAEPAPETPPRPESVLPHPMPWVDREDMPLPACIKCRWLHTPPK